MTQPLRVIHFLHAILKLDAAQFTSALYLHFLEREPRQFEYQHMERLLASTRSRVSIMLDLLISDEALHNYSKPPVDFIPSGSHTIASRIRMFYTSEPYFFIHSLYTEFLGRNPDDGGLYSFLRSFQGSTANKKLLASIFNSHECQQLLAAPQMPQLADPASARMTALAASISYRSRPVTHIGIFLAYPHPLVLDGEGIGRFLYRMIEGLLISQSHVHIHIATTEFNYVDSERTFKTLIHRFPGRIHMFKSNVVERFNTHVPAEVWLVPIVSLQLALFLNKPYIVCLHDLVHREFSEIYLSISPEFCHRVDRSAYNVLHQAAAVVSNSQYVRTKHAIGIAQLPVAKTNVIRLAPPTDEYSSFPFMNEQQFRFKYNIFYEYIVFPTVFRSHKNIERLILAFAHFKQSFGSNPNSLHLVFTDHYLHNPLQDKIHHMLQQLDELTRNSILFIGRIPKSDLPSLYRYAVGTIAPSLFEGSCPFPILESLTVDTPVAAANLEVTNEIIPDMEAVIGFNPYSIEQIQASILSLWIFRDQLLPRQKAAIVETMQRNWSHVANEYYSLFMQTLAGQ